jgi:hypothetical protein
MVELRPEPGQAPKPGTLRAWRKAVNPSFTFSVVLPKIVGSLAMTKAMEVALAEALAVATTVEARCIVLSTPSEVRPTTATVNKLKAVIEKLPRPGVVLCWEPHGIWERAEILSLAKQLGVHAVVDAAQMAVPPGPVVYTRLRALGTHGAVSKNGAAAVGPARCVGRGRAPAERRTCEDRARACGLRDGGDPGPHRGASCARPAPSRRRGAVNESASRQRRTSAAGASSPVAREAAEEALAANGSAADAVVAAFFAIAGSEPGGLFAPAVAIVSGRGVGRAFDGRASTGAGHRAPSFTGAVPLAARAAVPRSPHAMLVLHATFGRRTLRQVVRPGAVVARALGADGRAAFIERFADLGAPALASEESAIFRIAGPLASGLLAEADIAAVRVDGARAPVRRRARTAPMHIVLEPGKQPESAASVWSRGGRRSLVASLAVS